MNWKQSANMKNGMNTDREKNAHLLSRKINKHES